MKTLRLLAATALIPFFPLVGAVAFAASLPEARAGRPALVIALPGGTSAARRVARAGGYPVLGFSARLGLVAHSQAPDFLDRLRRGGPVVLLDAATLPDFLCTTNA
ncbi:hypothetical protein [Jannaschia marina]|uniref:hypothetical protein n=1 Tax=Jannaschia marina TaxID=2741674 RepID=UPI0015CCCAE4|nr:hypothetical protein [Jannaschia marina]